MIFDLDIKFKKFFQLYPMQKRMKKIFKRNNWSFDLVETLPETISEMFIEFYENGGLDLVSWEFTKDHKEVKTIMDNAYLFWKNLKPKWSEKEEIILDKWSSTVKFSWEECKDNKKLLELKQEYKSNPHYSEKLFSLNQRIHELIYRTEEKHLINIIKIRNFLWT